MAQMLMALFEKIPRAYNGSFSERDTKANIMWPMIQAEKAIVWAWVIEKFLDKANPYETITAANKLRPETKIF